MITDNKYIDLAHTIMGMNYFEDDRKNQIKAMLEFAEEYHKLENEKNLGDFCKCDTGNSFHDELKSGKCLKCGFKIDY